MKNNQQVVGSHAARLEQVTTSKLLGHRSSKQAGFGALEVMIALGVGIFAIVAAYGWYTKFTSAQNNDTELSNISSLTTNTKQIKTSSGYGPTGTDLVAILLRNSGVPESMQKSGGAIFNSFGGAVTITSTGTGYTLTYNGVPASNCIFLASKSANGDTQTLRINGGAAITGEVTAGDASTSCSAATNTLAWSSR